MPYPHGVQQHLQPHPRVECERLYKRERDKTRKFKTCHPCHLIKLQISKNSRTAEYALWLGVGQLKKDETLLVSIVNDLLVQPGYVVIG